VRYAFFLGILLGVSPAAHAEDWTHCSRDDDCTVVRKNCQWHAVNKDQVNDFFLRSVATDCYEKSPPENKPSAGCEKMQCIVRQ
jgi:hypothetical protein